MKKILIFSNIITLCSSVLFFSCEPRNVVEVEEQPLPQGERLFSPDWELTKELDGTDVNVLELSFNSYIIAASSSGNFFRSKNNGNDWTLIPAGNNPITAIHRSLNYIFAGTHSGELYHSNSNGRSWEITENFSDRITSITTAKDKSILHTTLSGLYRSVDNGETWNYISNGIPSNIRFFSLIVLEEGTLLAGSDDGLYSSADNGLSWNQTTFYETCYSLSQGYQTSLFAGTGNGVFRSDDNGLNWFQAGLSDKKIISLKVTKGVHVFAGSNKGIYYSHNNGNNWSTFGLTNKTVSSILDIQLKDMILAAADKNIYRILANN